MAQTSTGPPTLLAPETLRSNGADLRWTRYLPPAGATFQGYEVHRSSSSTFTPSQTSLIATLGEQNRTSYRDTTARASASFTYKIVANGEVSNPRSVSLPQTGFAVKKLQPEPAVGMVAWLSSAAPCLNRGASPTFRVGTETTPAATYRSLLKFDLRDIPAEAVVDDAKLSLHYTTAPVANPGAIGVHRVRRAWREGAGGTCVEGATWNEAQASIDWTAPGADFEADAARTLPSKDRNATGGIDEFTVTALVQKWVDVRAPNHGMLLRAADETRAAGKYVIYASDDATIAAQRPKLEVTYRDGSAARAPRVAISSPGPGARISGRNSDGTVPAGGTAPTVVTATASDDSRVERVEFFVGTSSIGVDSDSPYSASWTPSGTGSYDLEAVATDDAGNTKESEVVSVVVDNSEGPSSALAVDAPATVKGTTTVTANNVSAPQSETITKVEFYYDDILFATDEQGPNWSAQWNTLRPLAPRDKFAIAFDGNHVLAVKAYDSSGNVTTSGPLTVAVSNLSGADAQYKATFDLNAYGSNQDGNGPGLDTTSVPGAIVENKHSSAPKTDPSTATRDVTSAPVDDAQGMPQPTGAGCPTQAAYCADVVVTNTSGVTWPRADKLRLWYRWAAPNGAVVYEGPANESFLPTIPANHQEALPVIVYPPALPEGTEMAQYELRLDLYHEDPDGDAATNDAAWFADKGNPPVDNPVVVNKSLDNALGLERYFHFEGEPVGAGMTQLTNVANGNSLLRWTPFFAPGRGLSTMLDLTYNSLEDHSESPVGNNFSLSMSGLARFGRPIDIHPNKADDIAGRAQRYIMITDGDGTTHRFDGAIHDDGTVYWKEPPGVHLYLREYDNVAPGVHTDRHWALTRPDRVTFFFDSDGYPTYVRDKNGNEIKFQLDTVPPGEDPGGPKKRVVAVRDAGGRSFTIDYYSKEEASKPQVRGNIQTIEDHTGSALDFFYYDDGNLLRITQRGGTNADGSFLRDRSFTLTYTTPSGGCVTVEDGGCPSIPGKTARETPDVKTAQSTLLFGVIDPRNNETTFDYWVPGDPHPNCNVPNFSKLRWKLQTRTNRAGKKTDVCYNIDTRVTTVDAPEVRKSQFTYDATGKVTVITRYLAVDPVVTAETTQLAWTPDFHVETVTEPDSARVTRYTYDANGYVTSVTDQEGNKTTLDYDYFAADAGDPKGLRDRSPYWKAGRTTPHVSQLAKVTKPKGVVTTGDPDDFQWNFVHDAVGNLTKVIQPEPQANAIADRHKTEIAYNSDGSVASITDPNGKVTQLRAYDLNGLPTEIVDPDGNKTTFSYDADGLLRWIQDARHQSASGTDERAYRTFFDYDSFHRLGRQSAPKSTAAERGLLMWSSAEFDLNDNLRATVDPQYGRGQPEGGDRSTFLYDAMDRATDAANQEGHATEYLYDDAGRVVRVTTPKGTATSAPAMDKDFAIFFAYDKLDRVVKQTRHEVDDQGAILETRHTHFCYDPAGDLKTVTAPRAGVDSVPCPATTTPFTWVYEYDKAHRIVKSTDPNGNFRTQRYDANGNVDKTCQEYEGTTIDCVARRFDQRDLPVSTIEDFVRATGGRKVTSEVVYDAAGNVEHFISPRAYDSGVRASQHSSAWESDPPKYVNAYRYDGSNRVTREILPNSPDDPSTPNTDESERAYVHRGYDAIGNLTWTSLPTTVASGDVVGNSQLLARTYFTHFDPGWIKTSDDHVNAKVTYDYTAEGQQARRVPEVKGTTTGELDGSLEMAWTYHADGLLEARTDRGGQTATYEYDRNDNPKELVDGDGVVSPGEMPVEVSIDYNGFDEPKKVRHRKRSETSAPNDWTFSTNTYDKNGNVTQRLEDGKETDGGAQLEAPRTVVLTYDDADRLTVQKNLGRDATCRGDEKIENFYYDNGREKERKVHHPTTGCSADDSGWELTQTTTWSYFGNGKLDVVETTKGSGDVLQSHAAGYEDNGVYVNGHRVTDTFGLRGPTGEATGCEPTGAVPRPCTATFAYDPRDRLVRHDSGRAKITKYTYDEPASLVGDDTIRASNITTEDGPDRVTTRTYEGTQLRTSTTAGTTVEHHYTPLGDLDCVTLAAGGPGDCSPSTGATPSANLVSDYTYDYLDRLGMYRSFNGQSDKAEYTYDALDRVVKEVESHDEWGSGDRRTTTFSYLGLTNLVSEEQQTGRDARNRAYSYDAYGHRISMTTEPNGATPTTFAYGYDVHGSVSQLVETGGQVKASYGYTPYGAEDRDLTQGDETRGTAGDLNPLNPYRYTGKRMDTGMDAGAGATTASASSRFGLDMGARRFSPDTTRFIQDDMYYGALANLSLTVDPLTQNRYALAGGNPVSFVEWDGHMFLLDGSGASTRSGGGGGGTPDGPGSTAAADQEVARDDPATTTVPPSRQGDRRANAERSVPSGDPSISQFEYRGGTQGTDYMEVTGLFGGEHFLAGRSVDVVDADALFQSRVDATGRFIGFDIFVKVQYDPQRVGDPEARAAGTLAQRVPFGAQACGTQGCVSLSPHGDPPPPAGTSTVSEADPADEYLATHCGGFDDPTESDACRSGTFLQGFAHADEIGSPTRVDISAFLNPGAALYLSRDTSFSFGVSGPYPGHTQEFRYEEP